MLTSFESVVIAESERSIKVLLNCDFRYQTNNRLISDLHKLQGELELKVCKVCAVMKARLIVQVVIVKCIASRHFKFVPT